LLTPRGRLLFLALALAAAGTGRTAGRDIV